MVQFPVNQPRCAISPNLVHAFKKHVCCRCVRVRVRVLFYLHKRASFIWKADGFEATERVGVAASHRGLLKDETVLQLIQKWLGIDQKVSKHLTTSKVFDAALK